jgi:hypothetical protein
LAAAAGDTLRTHCVSVELAASCGKRPRAGGPLSLRTYANGLAWFTNRTTLVKTRLQFHGAYLAYKACADRILETTRFGALPTEEDLRAETEALAVLNLTRKMLLESIEQMLNNRGVLGSRARNGLRAAPLLWF